MLLIYFELPEMWNLLKDLDMLPKQTTNTKADGYNGEMRSISIPAINAKT